MAAIGCWLAFLCGAASAQSQAKEQFFPLLVYRTGAYAPNGTPWANGKQDYLKMIIARDGGVNGVKLTWEECETGYATDRGVECYERLKTRPGVTLFEPQSTGITFALNPSGQQPKVIQDILKYVHDKGQGTGPREEVGSVLYTRGVLIQMLGVEAVRRAQERFGKGKVVTPEQVRWGLENLALDQKRLDALGFAGVLRPISTSCADHMGSTWARIQTWDGSKWSMTSDFMQADDQIIKPMVKTAADKYMSEKKIPHRSTADCQT